MDDILLKIDRDFGIYFYEMVHCRLRNDTMSQARYYQARALIDYLVPEDIYPDCSYALLFMGSKEDIDEWIKEYNESERKQRENPIDDRSSTPEDPFARRQLNI